MKPNHIALLPPRTASLGVWGGVLAVMLVLACPVPAQAVKLVEQQEIRALAQRWVAQTLAKQSSRLDLPLRLQATLGELDSRLNLANCARVEPYLPAGSRLWGNARLGLRCLEGKTRWNVFIPVWVKALGPAWVMRRDVQPGETLQEGDLMLAEVDWAAEQGAALAADDPWLGQVATRKLRMGQTVRDNMLRAPQVFQPGAQVRVLVQGQGFQISGSGQALSAGVVGQPARVRMEGGRVMSGKVLDARTVSLAI